MQKSLLLLILLTFIAMAENNSDGEPDLGSIFGEEVQEPSSLEKSDEPDVGSIFGEEEQSDEPDLGDIFGEKESVSKQEKILSHERQLLESVAVDHASEEKSEFILPPRPTNIFPLIYYYLDAGPIFIQYCLRKGPDSFAEFLEKKIGIPTQHKKYPLELSGFVEGRAGVRWQKDKYESQASLGELRAQLEAHKTLEWEIFKNIKYLTWEETTFNFKGDIYGDFVTKDFIFDLREANIHFSPFDFADIKIGRQILTWGTGDMLFINDLFPKDWKSYFIGRDVEYLKAPSDALKLSLFSKWVNLDAVWAPVFNPDRYIDGQRISYWNPMLDRRAGRDVQISTDEPNRWFRDMEWHLRAYRNVELFDKSYQVAAYYYNGFWKSPAGFNANNGNAIFPRLTVYGGSVRGPVWKGIANMEFGYYDSRKDRRGSDPFVDNSQIRWLAGYELNMEPFLGRTIGKELTLSAQYYAEWMMNYDRYRHNMPSGIDPKEQYRQVVTLRATKMFFDQDLELSFFAYFSPSDIDSYLRPHISYKITDYWTIDAGANIFIGKEPQTFFGQFEKDSNVYLGLRFSF